MRAQRTRFTYRISCRSFLDFPKETSSRWACIKTVEDGNFVLSSLSYQEEIRMDATAVIKPQAPIAAISPRRWPLRMMLVLALAGVLFCARLSERALWSEEVRWAEIPREMQHSGNYFWPTINGRTYYDKPLGSYWLVLLASLVTGGVDEASARLPSALCGLIAVALAMLIARRLYDDDTALWSGAILATSFSFVFFARNASADVETCAGVLAALWLFLCHEAKPAGAWTVLLWFVMALTSLTKGLLGFALPILIIGLYSTLVPPPTRSLTRVGAPKRSIRALLERNRWLFNRWSLAAIPLSALVYLGPFLLSMAATGEYEGLQMVYRENIRRFFDPVNHRGPIYLYAYVIFLLMAPWSLLLPAALAHAHFVVHDSNRAISEDEPHDPRSQAQLGNEMATRDADGKEIRGRAFALVYFWSMFVFFTLSSSRRSYYLLPILPAGAFLIARLLAGRATLGRIAYGLFLAGFFLVSLAMLLSIAALAPASWWLPEPWDSLAALPCPVAFILMWLISIAGVGYALMRLSRRRVATSFGVSAFSFMAFLYLFALPATEIYRTQKPFADAVKQKIGSETDRLALYGTREIVYYLDVPAPIAEYHTPEELQRGLREKSLRLIVLRRRDWECMKMNGKVLVAETIHPWESSELAKNKLLLVEGVTSVHP
jgi:4-amino-4-deoxy-L-arabinose transferase-like glycosyltransferase